MSNIAGATPRVFNSGSDSNPSNPSSQHSRISPPLVTTNGISSNTIRSEHTSTAPTAFNQQAENFVDADENVAINKANSYNKEPPSYDELIRDKIRKDELQSEKEVVRNQLRKVEDN